MLRQVAQSATITPPDLSKHSLPEFEICEGNNDVTLTRADKGRGFIVYDVDKLFNKDDPAEPSAEAWKGVLQAVMNGWTLAEAAQIHTDELHLWSGCAKKALNRLREWTYIRATGSCYPWDGHPGKKPTLAEQEWAALPFDSFGK